MDTKRVGIISARRYHTAASVSGKEMQKSIRMDGRGNRARHNTIIRNDSNATCAITNRISSYRYRSYRAFNYLFAKHAGGQFILRIEDTDIERSKPEFEKDIIEGLSWLGLQWDEGPDVGGPYEPYRQAQRSDLYKNIFSSSKKKILSITVFVQRKNWNGNANFRFSPASPRNTAGSVDRYQRRSAIASLNRGEPLRFGSKITPKVFTVDDLIRGTLTFDTSSLDDFIIAKDFSTPLFVFAVVVDDYLMQISHVLRGEEHISNIPKQILLDEALGFDVPHFGHLSLILNSDRTKLSKRQNKVSLLEYRNEGILPEALINFIAFLGWNPGGDRELYTLPELVEVFDSAHVNKSGAIFDTKSSIGITITISDRVLFLTLPTSQSRTTQARKCCQNRVMGGILILRRGAILSRNDRADC